MEGWQKGADAVLRLSSAGKERYFKRFPERKSWFEANHPEHFGRSVSKATTSLKKVTTAKQKKQRLAAIRQAAEKINQLKISSDAVRAMGERRRQSGEGLGGGLETNRDIIAYATAGNYIKSGGLGSLYEQSDAIVKKGDKWIFKGVAYNSQKDAIAAMNNATAESPTTSNALQSTSPSKELQTSIKSGGNEVMSTIKASLGDFAKVGEIGLNVLTSPNPVDRVLTGIQDLKADWQKRGMWGRDWPKAGQGGNWEAMMRQQGKPVYMSDVEDLDDYLQRAPAGSNIDTRQKRLPFSTTVQVGDVPRKKGEMYFTGRNMEDISEDKEDMSTEENNFGKELAEKVIEEKRLQECMPMAMMIKASPEDSEMKDNKWDYMDSWKDNPIKKGSSSSEAEDEPGEYDYEGDMAKSQLRSIMHNSKMLHDMLEDNTNLPEWVQSKITLAEDYILTAANYMRGELKEMDEEVELDEESKNLRFDPEAPLRMSAPIVKMWKKSKTGDKKAAAAWAKHVRRIQKVEPEGMSKKDIEDHMQSHFGESVEITEEEIATLSEAKMTTAQMKKREKIVKGMKPISDWEKRYPGRGEMERMDEQKVYTIGNRSHDSELSKYLKGKLEKIEQRKAAEVAPETDLDLPFEPNAERPEMPAGKHPEQYRYVRGLARKAMKAGIAAAEQPVTHNDLVAQHMDLHQNTQVAEGMSAAVKLQRAFERAQAESAASRLRGKEILAQAHAKYVNDHVALHAPVPRDDENMAGEQLDEMDNYDMINRDALPVPPHRNIRGVQDRINYDKRKDAAAAKKKKIMGKVGKVIQKRKARPTDNPSENELVPRSMLPDVPGYPKGYQMEEQVVEQPIEQPIEQQVETPVVEENASPFVSAGSKFLTRTSARLVYGDKND